MAGLLQIGGHAGPHHAQADEPDPHWRFPFVAAAA
jgi:hypothetical protein